VGRRGVVPVSLGGRSGWRPAIDPVTFADTRRRRRRYTPAMARAVLVFLLAASLGACTLFGRGDNDGSFAITNETATTVTVVLVGLKGQEHVIDTMAAHRSTTTWTFDSQRCNDGRLVARDPTGREIAHLEGPLCGGSGWRVPAQPIPSA
jgi:hypothetical protein